MIVNTEAGTRIDEVVAGIYRICTPSEIFPGGSRPLAHCLKPALRFSDLQVFGSK